jgi:hypothetical protein
MCLPQVGQVTVGRTEGLFGTSNMEEKLTAYLTVSVRKPTNQQKREEPAKEDIEQSLFDVGL